MSATTTVGPIHFDDFSGTQFERLVFAYHARTNRWRVLDWYGQAGKDHGRDIWGVGDNDSPQGRKVCVLCANWGTLTSTKAITDMEKMVNAPTGKPDLVRCVTRSSVSAAVRDKIKEYARKKDIYLCEVWSGEEFEEYLRRDCETLLKRFVGGEAFPDSPEELQEFSRSLKVGSDQEALALLSRAFDRPAFTTEFRGESSLPAFRQALDDTILAIKTGVWQTRQGKEIGRLPSKHDVRSEKAQEALDAIVVKLNRLRSRFQALMHANKIRPCACGNPDCSTFMVSEEAADEMDRLRRAILEDYRRLYPDFRVCLP